jgi:4-amino-4-deoxy-L-arabinose transferase-like glycosyltransferase
MAGGEIRARVRRVVGEPQPDRRELILVACAVALAIVIRLAYVVITRGHLLAGDEPEYNQEGHLATQGHWLWTQTFGVDHPSMQKAPAYPLWAGFWYTLLGPSPDRVLAVQALTAWAPVGLTWLLGRRLFSARTGVAAAFLVAVAPNVWQYDVRLYSEVIATPLTLIVLFVLLEQAVSWRRTVAVGALIALNLYVRPTAGFLVATAATCWVLSRGWRRGLAHAGAAVFVAALLVAPLTLRNHSVDRRHLVLISIQDTAGYGTFNDDAAHDPVWPWAWRPVPSSFRDVLNGPPLGDGEFHEIARRRIFDYIGRHPSSVVKAFFWNGLSRTWDVRRPARAIDPARTDGRDRTIATLSYWSYWLIMPFALAGLWLNRRRVGVVIPLLVTALVLSALCTSVGGTRFRAPFEPVLAVFACCSGLAALDRLAKRRARVAHT